MSSIDRARSGPQDHMSRRWSARMRDRAATAGFLVLLVAFIGLVLVPGYRLANQLSADTAALKLASEQRGQPVAIAKSLLAVRDRLGSRAFVGQAVKDLGDAVQGFEQSLAQLKPSAAGNSAELREIEGLWADYRKVLDPVAGFEGLPYRESDAVGTQLSSRGRQLQKDTRQAINASREATDHLNSALSAVGTGLEQQVVTASATLRKLMITGVAFACLLLTLLAYFQWLKARHERLAVEARNQTRDILGTVRDGLFLIDADFRIGKTHSAALSALFRRDDFSGMTLEELLRDTVSEKTLATTTKYVQLLWGERANEKLIRSINPLAEVEVHFDRGDGSRDLRYLEFDFHRVKGEHGVRHVLVSVNDVTSRVLLARELKESQAKSQAQMDMLLGLLQVDPEHLLAFLDDTSAALAQINSVLRVPARGDGDFRSKIDEIFREMHRIKGDAATLGLASVETRTHAFEDLLQDLRNRPQLSGNDFLPLVVSLDEILGHLQSIRELASRAEDLRANALLNAAPRVPPATRSVDAGTHDIAPPLDALAQRIAADAGKKVRLVTAGLDEVPGDIRKTLRDVAIQLVRNAVVHGIEDAGTRRGLDKNEIGLLQLQFKSSEQKLELVFQDDGCGIVPERLREAAVRRGDLSPDAAEQLDTKASLALIFKPGFSTHDGNGRDAGRGVGLDFVLKAVNAIGGKISIATAPGKYTRFSIVLPVHCAEQGAVA
ncbi:MAG: Hpt domain-containing protein [Proteobacteria bacterium]|nr:Hpt domain-containing protein [Pseudomonadota bacterium]